MALILGIALVVLGVGLIFSGHLIWGIVAIAGGVILVGGYAGRDRL